MTTPEQALFEIIGFRPETNGIRWYSSIAFEMLAKLDYLLHHTVFEGSQLPTEGPVLLIGNHTSLWDPVKAYRFGQMTGSRIIRAFTRDSLLDPTIQESQTVLNKIGHKRDLLNSAPLPIRRLIGMLPAGFEAIPVSREPNRNSIKSFLARGKNAFDKGFAVGMFIQETRHKDGKLANLMRGAEWLARDNPDVPILPMGISVRLPHRVRTGPIFTYRQMVVNGEAGEIARQNFTVFLGDRIAELLDPEIKKDWYDNQRPCLLDRRKVA